MNWLFQAQQELLILRLILLNTFFFDSLFWQKMFCKREIENACYFYLLHIRLCSKELPYRFGKNFWGWISFCSLHACVNPLRLTSVFIFSILFSVNLLRCWRGEFIGDYFLYSKDIDVSFSGEKLDASHSNKGLTLLFQWVTKKGD